MTLPKVQAPELDGALGILPPTSGLPQAIVGQCTAGPLNTPAAFARAKDVIATFQKGRAVESACYAIERFQKPIIIVREETETAHAYSAVDDTAFAGTSVVTVDALLVPNDDYEVRVKFPTGGTIGTAGITLQWSLDDGRTYSPVVALGTANTFLITEGNVEIEFAAGTVVAGDELSFTATAESGTDTNLDDALGALADSALLWEFAQRAGFSTATAADVISAWLTTIAAMGKLRHAIGNFRAPTSGETEAQYLTAFATAFNAYGDTRVHMGAGVAKVASAVSRRRYRRPVSHPVAALLASSSEEVDIANVLIGRLPGVELRDSLGNPEAGYHDEAVNPGLDDVRALTLRTWEGRTGVYVTNPRLISPVGSDFDFSPKRRVMNLARSFVLSFFQTVLHRPLKINPKTGFLRESELLALETEVNAGLRRLILAKPKASSVRVVLSRTDAITTPPYPLTGQLRMVPLAYPKEISIESGWALTEEFEITGVATS